MSPAFKSGDLVIINDDIELVKQLQEDHGGWNEEMQRALGWKGKVVHVFPNGDLQVEVNGQEWTFNPVCCASASPARQLVQQPHRDRDDPAELLSTFVDLFTMFEIGAQELQRLGTAGVVHCQERQNTVGEGASGIVGLQAACLRGDIEVIRNYLSIGADLKTKDKDGNTALHHAAFSASTEAIRLLLKHGAPTNERNALGHTALHVAVVKQHAGCVSVLLEHACDVNVQDNNGNTALHAAVEQTDADIINKLVDHGCGNYGLNNDLGFNVLQHAVSMGNAGAVKKLLPVTEHLIDLRNVHGLAPLHVAAAYGHANIIEVLIEECHANMELRNGNCQTPFLLAVFSGNQQAADCLLESGADMQAQDDEGNTCLHYAVMMCGSRNGEAETGPIGSTGSSSPSYELLLYLLNRGADISMVNHAGKSVLDLAPCDSVRQMLLEYVVNNQAAAAVENNARALVSATIDSRPGTATSSTVDLRELERLRQLEMETTCPICITCRRNTVFSCGHTVCNECAERLEVCPTCRRSITSRLPFFL